MHCPKMVPEAPLEQTDAGLMPAGRGWFVLDAREARWFDTGGRGKTPGLQGKGDFPQVGLGLTVLEPGEPMSMYHWETDQEDFLVLSGEAVLIIEGEERPLRQWDFVHCPPETQHVIVGAGDALCVVFAVGALEKHTIGSRVDGTLQGTDDWGAYTVDEAALRHGAGVEEETNDAAVAYARFPELEPTRYRDSWLPST
jgi:quercetin dioxygenase-like cupin family protein